MGCSREYVPAMKSSAQSVVAGIALSPLRFVNGAMPSATEKGSSARKLDLRHSIFVPPYLVEFEIERKAKRGY
jgi:hypothetical protein